ncbi:MAG: hypothetical protein QOK30_663 [Nocardioidaceae bacterium]|jgi:hypothetical protein|nr:hypothetical protein [Nocardioidaceae bacterium]
MGEETSLEQQVPVHRDGADVVLALSASAARRLAGALTGTGSDDSAWLLDVARLLTAAAAEGESSSTAATEVPHTVLLRGNWSTDCDLDGPLPFTEARPLETIGPGLVGVWRTRLAGQAVSSGGRSEDADPVGTERLDAAARLVDAVAAAKADASTAASVRAVETRMEGARAALADRVSAAPVDTERRPGEKLPEQDAGPTRRRIPATPDV